MSQDTRGGLLWDDEPGLEDKDSTWEHDRDFDLTEEDFQVMNSMAGSQTICPQIELRTVTGSI